MNLNFSNFQYYYYYYLELIFLICIVYCLLISLYCYLIDPNFTKMGKNRPKILIKIIILYIKFFMVILWLFL